MLATLSLVALAQAQKYELSCSKSELSIRWPSYESNSEYYICPRLFGKQMTVTCEPGQVFTFVLQSCTAPSKYIPAPALDALPTASPLPSKPNKDGYLTPMEITHLVPPRLSALSPPVIDMPAQPLPPVMSAEVPKMPSVVAETPKLEETKLAQSPVVAAVEEPAKPIAPLPPTPAPTPPVVEKSTAASKKPAAATANKKKSSAKPSKNAKKTKNDKKTTKTDKSPKKTAKKPAKKSPKA